MTHEKNSSLKKQAFLIWLLSIFSTGISAVLAFLLYVLPFDTIKHIFDQLTRDGDAKPFTPVLNANLHPIYALVFLIGLALCGSLLLKKRSVEAGIEKFLACWVTYLHRLAGDSRHFLSDLRAVRLARWEVVLLALITLMAAWLRLYPINQQMDYDEAYTYIAFASKSVWTILSDYHLPNNHVFHSLFVHLATQITGSEQPWSVRLPAFFAGVLLVPAIYFLARRLFNRPAAIVTICLVVVNPFLIRYSTNARGYSLLALITVLAFGIGAYLLRCKNLFAWLLLGLICALGFFTVPVMLFPFGCLFLWLFFSGLAGDLGPDYAPRRGFWIYLVGAIGFTGLLTTLFYTPILLVSGLKELFGNQFVAAISQDQFLPQLWNDVVGTWSNNWFLGMPVWVRTALGLAAFGSILLHRRVSVYKIPILAAAAIWIVLTLFIQRPATYPRTWVFLLPLFLMWSAAGLTAIVQQIHLPEWFRLQPTAFLNLAAVCALFFMVIYQTVASPINFQLDAGDARTTIKHLQGILQPGDMIIVAFPADAPLQYYAQISGVPTNYFYLPKQGKRAFSRAFLVVSPNQDQSIKSVLQARNLDESRFDLQDRQTESDFGVYTVYRVYPAGQ